MNVAMIQLILTGIEIAAAQLPKLIAAAKQSGELTAEQAAAFEARMEAVRKSAAFQSDAQLGGQ